MLSPSWGIRPCARRAGVLKPEQLLCVCAQVADAAIQLGNRLGHVLKRKDAQAEEALRIPPRCGSYEIVGDARSGEPFVAEPLGTRIVEA